MCHAVAGGALDKRQAAPTAQLLCSTIKARPEGACRPCAEHRCRQCPAWSGCSPAGVGCAQDGNDGQDAHVAEGGHKRDEQGATTKHEGVVPAGHNTGLDWDDTGKLVRASSYSTAALHTTWGTLLAQAPKSPATPSSLGRAGAERMRGHQTRALLQNPCCGVPPQTPEALSCAQWEPLAALTVSRIAR